YLLAHDRSDTFNLGTGRGFSVREIVRAVERCSGTRIKVNYEARRAGDPPALIASADKARTVLNWHPRITSLDEIVSTAWRWHTRDNVPAIAAAQFATAEASAFNFSR